MPNPLLSHDLIPDFSRIAVAHFEPALDTILAANRQLVADLLAQQADSWECLAQPLAQAEERLAAVWSIVSLYNAVLNSAEVQALYPQLLTKMTAYNTELGQNKELFLAYQRLSRSEGFDQLSEAQQASVKYILRDYRLSGVDLSAEDKLKYSAIKQELSSLSTQFAQNVLDATQGWEKYLPDDLLLQGVPDSTKQLLSTYAKERGHESGYLLTLDIPCYLPLISHCENRDLREELYQAYMTRASDQGPNAGKWDNSAVMVNILEQRQALANLLGFSNFAELSIEDKMAPTAEAVVGFLEDLVGHSRVQARNELATLQQFAYANDGLNELELWDLPYYSEKFKQQQFGLSVEALRPYLPVPKVLGGLFETASRLFDVQVRENSGVVCYHPDVRYFEVWRGDRQLAGFFVDLYARKDKRGGAWLASCRIRHQTADAALQLPQAFLVCNFSPALGEQPSLLTPDEVRTLFHEFGHCLHYMLTQVEVPNVACIRGVPWDAVELPSQLLENWCWQDQVVPMISGHIDSGEPLPQEVVDNMQAAKTFQSGLAMVRQLEFALFDFLLHRDFDAGQTEVQALLATVRSQVSVKEPPAYTRFSHAFTHIFAGGYAAGYYSYKWAEVLAADVFSCFEDEGVFNPATGKRFRTEVLEQGGVRDVLAMFVAFQGREPRVEALLKQSGISV